MKLRRKNFTNRRNRAKNWPGGRQVPDPPPPPGVPTPTMANYVLSPEGIGSVTVFFDGPLKASDQSILGGGWSGRIEGHNTNPLSTNRYTLGNVAEIGNWVVLAADAGDDRIVYDGSDTNFVDLLGRPIAAFELAFVTTSIPPICDISECTATISLALQTGTIHRDPNSLAFLPQLAADIDDPANLVTRVAGDLYGAVGDDAEITSSEVTWLLDSSGSGFGPNYVTVDKTEDWVSPFEDILGRTIIAGTIPAGQITVIPVP